MCHIFCHFLTLSSGFILYSEAIFGQTPCASVLPRPMSTPAAISQDIQSLSSFAATATVSRPASTVSVEVIVNQVFALNLPLKQGVERAYRPSMSTGVKVGIGVSAGLGALFLFLLCAWLIWFLKRRRSEDILSPAAPNSANDQSATWVGGYYRDSDNTAISSATAVSSIPKSSTPPVSIRGPNWQLQSQQNVQQHPYIRQPPPRFTEGFMGMPTDRTSKSPLPRYSPPHETQLNSADSYRQPMSELPDRGLEIHEAGSGDITPLPRRKW